MGFYTTCFHVRLRNLRTGYTFFFHKKEFSSPLTSWTSGSDKRRHDNSSLLLMRSVWPKKKKKPFLFGIVPFHSHLDQEEACMLGKFKRQFPLKMLHQPIRNEQCSGATAQPRAGRGVSPDGLFHPRFWWSTTEPEWLGETEMQFGSCFIR